jgi:hypothetical protein
MGNKTTIELTIAARQNDVGKNNCYKTLTHSDFIDFRPMAFQLGKLPNGSEIST